MKLMKNELLCFYSPQENIGRKYWAEWFNAREDPKLTVGDLFFPEFKKIIEIKFGADVHDYNRLQSELARMAQFRCKHPDFELHLCYTDTISYSMNMREMKLIYSWCTQYGVMFHHDEYISAKSDLEPYTLLHDTLNLIINDKYKAKAAFTEPPKSMPTLARMFACIKGVSNEKAILLAENCLQKIENMYDVYDNTTHVNERVLIATFGTKKDGSRLAIVQKIIDFFEQGDEKT